MSAEVAGLPPRALVIGTGASGRASAQALVRHGVEVVVADAVGVDDEARRALVGCEIRSQCSPSALASLVEATPLVVPSPGVPEHHPALVAALASGVEVWSEPELGWRLAPRRVIAVTGTNGKTTVTELITAMLADAGISVLPCGNIGDPFTTVATSSDPDATLVAELSSFQLRFTHTLRPAVGLLTNLAPDHLDWHGGADAYAAAKARIWRSQAGDDRAVSNAADPAAAALARAHAPTGLVWFDGGAPVAGGVGVQDGALVADLPVMPDLVLPVERLSSAAPHHAANLAAAACAALLAGAPPASVAAAAARYRPGRHRLEVVASGGDVTWVDDSKATNPHAAAAALRAFGERPLVWIAGGRHKGVDLAPLADVLGGVRHAIVLGEAAELVAALVDGLGIPVTTAATIEEAVEAAARVARPGDTVLLAPACASQDQFRDYAERGDRFAAAAARAAQRSRGPARREVTRGRA